MQFQEIKNILETQMSNGSHAYYNLERNKITADQYNAVQRTMTVEFQKINVVDKEGSFYDIEDLCSIHGKKLGKQIYEVIQTLT